MYRHHSFQIALVDLCSHGDCKCKCPRPCLAQELCSVSTGTYAFGFVVRGD